MSEKIFPIEECMEYEEFTDRVELLRELETWIKNVRYKRSGSTSIISPRRLGKTVLLERLVNTVFFKPEYHVAPIYFSMGLEKITLRAFIMQYAETFFRQYIAYCLQDPDLYKNRSISPKNLVEIETNNEDVKNAQKHFQRFLTFFKTNPYDSVIPHWANVICLPELVASSSNTYAAIIIDEFQEMKFSVYNTSDEKLIDYQAKGLLTDQAATDLTASYRRLSQSRVAPMLVSGSAVTIIFKTVMGGPLGGRFGFRYVKPLSIPDGVTLLFHLIRIYRSDEDSTIQMTSDGDQAVERSDKWYFSNDSGTVGDEPDDDPVFTLSRFFDGAEVIPTSVAFPGNETEDGDYDFFTEKYDITVQPGTTARILIFCQLSSSNADAQAGAADFETLEAAQNAGLLNGLSASEINEIVNGGPVETLEPTEVKAHSIPVMGFIAELLFTGFLGLFGITSLRRRKKNDPS
jgi:hypothetical protein